MEGCRSKHIDLEVAASHLLLCHVVVVLGVLWLRSAYVVRCCSPVGISKYKAILLDAEDGVMQYDRLNWPRSV